MKRTIRGIFSLAIALVMLLSLGAPIHAETYDYAVQGGTLKFDPTTGTITQCSSDVYEANIPSEILGVPVTKIKGGAFWFRKKLQKVTIPSSVTEIGGSSSTTSAFGSSPIIEITIPSSVTKIGSAAFRCTKLKTLTIPGSVKVIEKFLCDRCSDLTSVTLEEGTVKIEDYAFTECTSLEGINIPNSVEEIGKNVFRACKSLSTITLGSGVKFIDDRAFLSCSSLKSVYFSGNAPSFGKEVFKGTSSEGIILYYPEGASGWTTPTWNGYITKPYTPSGTQSAPAATSTPSVAPASPQPASNLVTAVPSYSPVYVNGVQVQFDAYNINKNNYFKLRDLAFILSGTKAQFNVEWKGAVAMTSGQSYTPVGGEMAAGSGINQIAEPTSSAVLLDGNAVDLAAYNINKNNYFKLRDIAKLFNFDVHWDSTLQGIVIQTNDPYIDV